MSPDFLEPKQSVIIYGSVQPIDHHNSKPGGPSKCRSRGGSCSKRSIRPARMPPYPQQRNHGATRTSCSDSSRVPQKAAFAPAPDNSPRSAAITGVNHKASDAAFTACPVLGSPIHIAIRSAPNHSQMQNRQATHCESRSTLAFNTCLAPSRSPTASCWATNSETATGNPAVTITRSSW